MCTLVHAYLHTNSFVHTDNVFRSALQNAGKHSVFRHALRGKTQRLQARSPRENAASSSSLSLLTQNSIGLRRPRFPTSVMSLSWINLPNISISGLINPRSENIVQILVATFTLLALLPRSFYFQSILRDRFNQHLADPQVYDFPFSIPEPWIMHLRYSVWPFKNVGAILGHANAAAYADNMHGCGQF